MAIEESHWIRQRAIAHRGYHQGRLVPENSLKSFELAMERGLPIEMDVRILGDGTAVIFHDKGTKRLCGEDKLLDAIGDKNRKDFRLFESDEHIPSFNEVLEFINGKVPILLEIKSDDRAGHIEKAVYKCMRSYKGDIAVQSFNPWTVGWFRHYTPAIKRGLLGMAPKHYQCSRTWELVLGNLLYSVHVAPDFYGYDKSGIDRTIVQFWSKTMDAPLLAWTVKTDEDLELVTPYVDNIIFENFEIRY